MALSKFFLPYMKTILHPFRAINKKIHEATGTKFAGGGVRNPPAGDRGSANFRQVGRVPEDQSGYRTQHLGGKK